MNRKTQHKDAAEYVFMLVLEFPGGERRAAGEGTSCCFGVISFVSIFASELVEIETWV